MGQAITITNDMGNAISGVLLDSQGSILEGFDFNMQTGERKTFDTKAITPGRMYKVIVETSQTMKFAESSEKTIEFYAPRLKKTLHLKTTKLDVITQLEMETLINDILPGLRIADRQYLGKTYNKVFIANELVAHLILHKIAIDTDEAVAKCQKLVKEDIFRHVAGEKEFGNRYLFYWLKENHNLIESKGRIKNLDSSELLNSPRSALSTGSMSPSMRFKRFSQPRLLTNRGMEGWLEKKSKLGYWQKRYFRVLEDGKDQNSTLAYFESTTSINQKGAIPCSHIRTVEMESLNRANTNIVINMVAGYSGKSYVIRAPSFEVAQRWVDALKRFAKELSPIDVVTGSALVFVFTDEMVEDFSRMLKPKFLNKGKWLCKRGDRSDDFYLLRSGTLGVYIRGRNGKENFYCHQSPISFIGEQIFTSQGGPIPAQPTSVKAETDCHYFSLSKRKREAFVKKFAQVKGPLHVLLQSGINKRLEQVPFLRGLSSSDLVKFKIGLHYHALEPGEVLFHQGDRGSKFFIVYAGELNIVQTDQKRNKETLLKKVGKADYFGEIALMLSGIPRTASVIATKKSLLLSLHETTFKNFMKFAHLDISEIMRERIVNTFWKCKIPFFNTIQKEAFIDLAKECSIETFKKDEVIFNEGDPGDKFYIVSYGEVKVTVDNKEMARVETGKFFGEIALVVDDTPRTATCSTTRPTILMSIPKAGFRKFFEERPEALADVELKIAGKKCQIRSIIYHPKGNALFTKYLKSQYAEESMEYWHQVREYRKWATQIEMENLLKFTKNNTHFDPKGKEEMLKRAKVLVKKFIEVGSERQVNISNEMAKKILNEVEAGNATAATFVESEDEVVTLMSRDKLGSFKQSEEFKELMEIVGGYVLEEEIMVKGGKKRGGSIVNLTLDGLIAKKDKPPEQKTANKEEVKSSFHSARAVFESKFKHSGIA
uniref:cGMP-dependent protein kinase n=2 Tax=Lotharella globosa TaxID=91324 RepID=A0A7S4DPH8_9EUKA|mmetsp:Transcript_19327/g.39124  ORF Transcript_19327/g.39124 Transcript_19327/m.39124 type:complete len:941 (+) Transcript_19327:111-2933(+)